jgi:hypothetical protein
VCFHSDRGHSRRLELRVPLRSGGSSVHVAALQLVVHPVSRLLLLAQGRVGPVERDLPGVGVRLDVQLASDGVGEVLVDHGKDRQLLGNDTFFPAGGHVRGDVVDETLLGAVVKDSLPQVSRLVEVLLPDLGQEGDGVSDKVVVNLVETDRSRLELDRVDRREVVGSSSLVVKGLWVVQPTSQFFERWLFLSNTPTL